MAEETKIAHTPEEHRLWLESTTEQSSETLRLKEIEERTVQNSWGSDVLAPSYWTYDDIARWKEMVSDSEFGHDAEIVSLLDFVTETVKVINGDEPLDYINNLENITLPHRIENMEQLVAEEKENRRAAYEYFQKERTNIQQAGENRMNIQKTNTDVSTYRFASGETIDEILRNQSNWETDEQCLLNMIDSDLRSVEDFTTEKEKDIIKRISVTANLPETDLKLLAVQTDAAVRFLAAKHYSEELSNMGQRPYSADVVNVIAQKDFPYELPSWMKDALEEFPETNFDKTVESLQANGGLSDAAEEADYNAFLAENQEISEEENEEVYTMFLDADRNPHYPQEIVSALEAFSKIEPEKWNLPATDKTAVFHLIDIAQIKDGEFENSVKKLTVYLNSEEYEHHQENYAKIFTPILLTNVGQDFDAKTHMFSSDKFSYAFSTDDIQNEKELNAEEDLSQYYERFAKETENRSEEIQLQKAIALSLDKNVSPLTEIKLNRENWNKLFPDGMVETPVGTVKLGDNQFEKLQKSDRNNLLAAMYETLSNPAIVLEKETLDKNSGEFRPVNVYGKSFVREDSNHKRAVESVIIFKDGEEISIGTHNKNINDFVKQIKTADQIIFADSEISRVASLVLEHGGSHVRLHDAISNRAINSKYNKDNLLSIKDLQFSDVEERSQVPKVSLEQQTLEKASELLKNMTFSSENYKDLLGVINKISAMNGRENLQVPKEEKKSQNELHGSAKAKDLFSDIASVLDEGTVYSAKNNGENIELRRGQKRTGLIHIITRRYEEKVLNKKVNMSPEKAMKEITALSYLIADSLDKGELKQTPKGNWEINQNGIQSIITKDKNGKFVLTGYEFNDTIEAARNSINAVIAQYENTPEFLGVYAQVGAALTSYGYTINQSNSLVNEKSQETAEPNPSNEKSERNKENLASVAPFDPTAPIVYGETVLPAFAVMADGKLQSIENAVVTGYDKENRVYTVDNGSEKMELPKATLETLLNDKREQEQIQAKRAEGRTIVFADEERGVKGTVIPEFAMYTAKGLETFKDFVPLKFNAAENSYTLSNGDTKMTVSAERFKEITASERFEDKFDENSPAWMKLCETQYNDFFRQRDNTAYNFRHNLSVYCRKEANSPCDALHLAKSIIAKMPKDEKKKTQKLLQNMAHENESTNELIARIYHESIKEMPLNEEYIKAHQPEKVIAHPFYDTISDEGKKIETDPLLIRGTQDRNLAIGAMLRNIDIQTGKLFGKGKDSMHFDELKVVSASKEGNSITLMDSNKSYFKLPRDTVLSYYKEQQLKEMKHEQRQTRSSTMKLGYA